MIKTAIQLITITTSEAFPDKTKKDNMDDNLHAVFFNMN